MLSVVTCRCLLVVGIRILVPYLPQLPCQTHGSRVTMTQKRLTVNRSVIAWGDIAETSKAEDPTGDETWRIVVPVLPAEIITHIACAAAHILFVTSFGNLFSCGDNAEGALGHGDRINKPEPTPVLLFEEEQIRIVAATAGSGLVGAHSACITDSGDLYCWGVGLACGLGVVADQLLPKKLDEAEEAIEHSADSPKNITWGAAACGGGFTVAVTSDGCVYSWGMWARGRLGRVKCPASVVRYPPTINCRTFQLQQV